MPAPTVVPAVPTFTPAAPTPQPVEIRFTGVLEARGPQTWQVAGRVVVVTAATEIRDDPQVGQVVEVRLHPTGGAGGIWRAARVIWTAAARGGHYFTGVEFETPLNSDALESLRPFCRPGPS